MKFWTLMGEGDDRHELDLEVQLEDGKLILQTASQRLSADVAELPDGESYSLLVGGRSYEVSIEEEGDHVQVTLDGRRFRVSVRSPLEKTLREVTHSSPEVAGSVLRAPMPGLVVSIKVRPGEEVQPGQALAVIEAMKMQNELAAETLGTVKTIHVTEGQTVEAGKELVTLAPASGEDN